MKSQQILPLGNPQSEQNDRTDNQSQDQKTVILQKITYGDQNLG